MRMSAVVARPAEDVMGSRISLAGARGCLFETVSGARITTRSSFFVRRTKNLSLSVSMRMRCGGERRSSPGMTSTEAVSIADMTLNSSDRGPSACQLASTSPPFVIKKRASNPPAVPTSFTIAAKSLQVLERSASRLGLVGGSDLHRRWGRMAFVSDERST